MAERNPYAPVVEVDLAEYKRLLRAEYKLAVIGRLLENENYLSTSTIASIIGKENENE